jgi:hypothetical protein
MQSLKAIISTACLVSMLTITPMGNPAHAGPEPAGSIKGSPVGPMGTVIEKVDLNTKRAEAAKRLKQRRDIAAAAKKAEAAKKATGGAQ